MSEKRWFTATGACGVPQSSRVSDMSAACAGAARAMNAPAQAPAASMLGIHFIGVSLDASHPGSGSLSPPVGSAADSREICSQVQRSAGRVGEPREAAWEFRGRLRWGLAEGVNAAEEASWCSWASPDSTRAGAALFIPHGVGSRLGKKQRGLTADQRQWLYLSP